MSKPNKLNLKWVSDVIGDNYLTWGKGDIIRLEAQTGTGKTYFIITKLLAYAIESNKRILYICNRINLKRQMKIDVANEQNIKIKHMDDFKRLDKLEEIGLITITSYQKIQHFSLNEDYGLNKNDIYEKYLNFDYVVMDELHYILQDSSFGNQTVFFYQNYLNQYSKDSVTILISATFDYIQKPLEKIYDSTRIKDFSTGTDYSYVNAYYFNSYYDIINSINNDQSNNKWLVFVSNIKKASLLLEEIKDSKFICSENGKYKDKIDKEELNNIPLNHQFNCKCLVATKSLDNGINIKDPLLTNIVIITLDKVDFIQMLGRKRIDIEDAQKINLYIMKRSKKTFQTLLNRKYAKPESIVITYQTERNKFNREYDINFDKLGKYKTLFYKDKDGWQLNEIGYSMFLKQKGFCENMVASFEIFRKEAFILEQLNWIGVDYLETNWIEEVKSNKKIDLLIEYLKELVGIKLFKEDQQKLKEFITKDFDSMVKKLHNDRHKKHNENPGLKILNKLLVVCDIPYIIKSFQETSNSEGDKGKRYWLIEDFPVKDNIPYLTENKDKNHKNSTKLIYINNVQKMLLLK